MSNSCPFREDGECKGSDCELWVEIHSRKTQYEGCSLRVFAPAIVDTIESL